MTRTKARPKWAAKLTAKQWAHLCDDAFDSRPTLAGFKRTIKWHRSLETETSDATCWECRAIARTLGI